MKLLSDSGNGLTPELLESKRTSRAVNGHAVGSDESRVRGQTLVLRFASVFTVTPLYRGGIKLASTKRRTS